MSQKIVIIGATSGIAQVLGRQFANQKNELFLIGRNELHLKTLSDDFSIRSEKPCQWLIFHAEKIDTFDACLSRALSALTRIDMLIIAHGTLPHQIDCQRDYHKAIETFELNATSYIGLLTLFAFYFEKQKSGSIVAFSSCAGDRGRKSNYVYGAAKSAISTFCAGLQAHLREYGVNVLTVKPGFVDTPMTAQFKKGFLWAQPEDVAAHILHAIEKKKTVVYTPWFWRYIMLIIKILPQSLMSKL